MNIRELLIDLEEPLYRMKCGVNALELMMYGLEWARDPCAGEFFAIWDCLRGAEEDIEKAVEAVDE